MNKATTEIKTVKTELAKLSNGADELMTADDSTERLARVIRVELIRQAYYAIADMLPSLAEQLELADLDLGGDAGPLLDEHYKVCAMLDTFKTLELGKVL